MKNKGIATIVEALFSSLLIIVAFSVGFYLMSSPTISHQRYSEDLTKFGYTLLSDLAANDGFDKVLYSGSGNIRTDWGQQLKVVIESFLPNNIIFNVTVYNASLINNDPTQFVDLTNLNDVDNVVVSNADAASFLTAGETAQVSYIYTTKQLNILVISLQLAILGGT